MKLGVNNTEDVLRCGLRSVDASVAVDHCLHPRAGVRRLARRPMHSGRFTEFTLGLDYALHVPDAAQVFLHVAWLAQLKKFCPVKQGRSARHTVWMRVAPDEHYEHRAK